MFKRRCLIAILGMAALAGAADTQARAKTIRVGGTGAMLASIRTLGAAFTRQNPDISVEVPVSLGSSGGIKAVIAGALDIGLSARPLKDSERAAGARATPFAMTPFLLATSNRSRIKALSTAGLASLIDSVRAWPDGTPIRLILRPVTDSDTRLMARYFPRLDEPLRNARLSRGVRIASTDQEALDLAESATGTLVPTALILLLSEDRKLTPLVIDGVAPNIENMENGTYRKTKTLYLVTTEKRGAAAWSFVDFLYTVEARAVLRSFGAIQFSEPASR